MHNIKTVKSDELFPAIQEFLQNNQKVRMTVTGSSMTPFLRENIDSVELSAVNFSELRFGQIPLIRKSNGLYVLHRIIFRRKNCFYIAGDAQCWVDGPILPEHLIAVVTQVWRKDKPVSPYSVFWKFASCVWWIRLPIRYFFIFPIRKILRLFRK